MCAILCSHGAFLLSSVDSVGSHPEAGMARIDPLYGASREPSRTSRPRVARVARASHDSSTPRASRPRHARVARAVRAAPTAVTSRSPGKNRKISIFPDFIQSVGGVSQSNLQHNQVTLSHSRWYGSRLGARVYFRDRIGSSSGFYSTSLLRSDWDLAEKGDILSPFPLCVPVCLAPIIPELHAQRRPLVPL